MRASNTDNAIYFMPEVNVALYADHPQVKGVFVEGCVERGDGSSFRRKAHAHTSKTDKHSGWICIRSRKRLIQKSLLIHELAHILTGHGHDDIFRRKVRELGGTINWWETKEYHQLRKAGYRNITRRFVIRKREVKRLLARK